MLLGYLFCNVKSDAFIVTYIISCIHISTYISLYRYIHIYVLYICICVYLYYIYMYVYIQKHTYMIYIHNIEIDKYICIHIFTLFAYIYMYICMDVSLRKKCPYLGLFWLAFSHIWTEYGEIWSISLYSVRMLENADQKNHDTHAFHAVYEYIK